MFRFFMAIFGLFAMFEIIIPLIFNKPLFYHLRPSTYRKRFAELDLEQAKKQEKDAKIREEAAKIRLSAAERKLNAINTETAATQLEHERLQRIEHMHDVSAEPVADHSGAQPTPTGKVRSQE